MEKIMYLLHQTTDKTPEVFREQLRKQFKVLEQLGASGIRLTIVDNDVAAAQKLVIRQSLSGPDAILSLWLNSAIASARQDIEHLLEQTCRFFHAYLVTESEPIINTLHPPKKNTRCYGMNQVVLLRKPENLGYSEWIDIWHNSHTQIAMDTQSTFGYRQNVVARPLTLNAPPLDAIVEENFPPEAMQSAHAFYNALGDDVLLKKNQQTMFESVQRFIDFNSLVCLPMSEYNH